MNEKGHISQPGILPDRTARERIRMDLNTNFLVEAGAGSGKTTSLVKRMTALVKSGKYRTGEMAAITFTRKAARELKERFQTELEAEFKQPGDPVEKENLSLAIAELEQVFTGTVHSFCARLLRERPVEAGIDPDFQDCDELEEELLRQEAWESYLTELRVNSPELLTELERLGISPVKLREGFDLLNLYPEVEVFTAKLQLPELQQPFAEVMDFVKEAVRYIPGEEPEKGYDRLQARIRSAYRLGKYLELTEEKNLVLIISLFDSFCKPTYNRWGKAAHKAKEYEAYQREILNPLAQRVLREWREYCHYHVIRVLLPAVRHYRELRRRDSLLIFQDLLLNTSRMLRENPEVRRYFQQKYRSILVDEFQDTDPIQAEIIFYLTGTDFAEQDWTVLKPRQGSLFMVGDPKQSIYRFRRADIDIYNLVKGLLTGSGGEVLKLTANFRSVDSLAAYLNPLFRRFFPVTADDYQAGYEPVEPVHPDERAALCGVRKLVIPAEYSSKDEAAGADARLIARIIKTAVEKGLNPPRGKERTDRYPVGKRMPAAGAEGVDYQGELQKMRYQDFMILLPYRDGMDIYARTLENYGIPAVVSGESTLHKSLEIKELYKLLKLLEDTDNQLLLAAVLKGIFYGVSDQELYQFKIRGGCFNIYSEIPEGLDDQTGGLFKNTFKKLQKYRGWAEGYPPSVFLEKLINDLGLLPLVSRQEGGMSRCANIYFLLERIRKAETGGRLSFQDLLKELEVIRNTGLKEELILNREENAVRVMNLHKAKGLEAPAVFLAHPRKLVKREPSYHISRGQEKTSGYFVISHQEFEHVYHTLAQPVNWERHLQEERKYQQAEMIRNLYVAATRAGRLLVISSSGKSDDRNFWAGLLSDTEEIKIALLDQPPAGDEAAGNAARSADQVLSLEDFQEIRRGLADWKEDYQLDRPGYLLASPSEFKDGAYFSLIEREPGGGKAWGTAVHRVMEKLVEEKTLEGQEMDVFIGKTLSENGLPLERKGAIRQIIKQFQQTELWQRINGAAERFTEIPFSIKVEPEDTVYEYLVKELSGDTVDRECKAVSDQLEGVPIILSGVIDLVFRDKQGWVIVDYKTDRVEKESDLAVLRKIYKMQIELYVKVWEEYVGGQTTAGRVVFL